MKKILLTLLLLLPISLFAANGDIKMNISRSLDLEQNAGRVELGIIKIDLKDFLTKDLNFSISQNDYLIFDSDVSNIKLNGIKINEKQIVLRDENKVLELIFDKKLSGVLEISGLYIRTYEKDIHFAKIGFDYDNNGIVDVYSSNTISLAEDKKNNDRMQPLAIRNLTSIVTKNNNDTYNVLLNWDKSVDLDVYGTWVKVKKNDDYGNILEKFITNNQKQSFEYTNIDVSQDTYTFNIYSKDQRFGNSKVTTFILDMDYITKYFVMETSIEEPLESKPTEEIKVEELKRYVPTFTKYRVLYKIAPILDSFIKKNNTGLEVIEKKNIIIKIRNDLLLILEDIDSGSSKNIQKNIIKFKLLLKKFKNYLK